MPWPLSSGQGESDAGWMAALGSNGGCTAALLVPRISHIAHGRRRGVRRTGMTSLCFVGGSCDALPIQGSGIFDVFSPIEPGYDVHNRDGPILRVLGTGRIKPRSDTSTWPDVGGSAGVANDRRSWLSTSAQAALLSSTDTSSGASNPFPSHV